MKNKFIILTAFLSAVFSIQLNAAAPVNSTYHAADVKFASYPNELKIIVQMLMRIPEIKNLLGQALQDGPIKVKVHPSKKGDEFIGCWDSHERTIVIDRSILSDPAKVISTIVFEMHNAISNAQFERLNQMAINGMIDKERFVRETEWIEHQNLLQCSSLLNQCVRSGKLPREVDTPVIRDFEKHYQVQQLNGHSHFLAWCYDGFNPNAKVSYTGTIPGFHSMSDQEKDRLMNNLVRQYLEYFGS